jgi:HEAT repeat protein
MATQLKSKSVGEETKSGRTWMIAGIGVGGVAAIGLVLYLLFGRGPSVATLAADLVGPDPHKRHVAARQLSKVGLEAREALPELTQALDDPDKRVRHAVAKTMSELGIEATPAVTRLIGRLGETEADTRYYIVKALSKIDLDKEHVAAIPGLVLLLKDENPKTRYYAAKCLKDIGPHAKSALPALQAAANDPDAETREQIAAALQKVSKPK